MVDKDISEYKKNIDWEIGQRIQKARLARSLKQSDLAAALGVTSKQISKYENGVASCSAAQIRIIAEELEVSTAYLLEGETEDNNVLELARKIMKLPIDARRVIMFGINGIV